MSLSNGAIAAVAIAHSGKHFGTASITPTATAYIYTGLPVILHGLLAGTYTLSGQAVSLVLISAVARQRLTAVDGRTDTFTAIDPRITTLTAVDGRAISFTQTVGDRQT